MHIRHTMFICILVLLLLAGCSHQSPPQQVDMEEYLFQSAIDDCRQKVRDSMHDEHPQARAFYFRICMDRYGYDEKSYKHLWIDALY